MTQRFDRTILTRSFTVQALITVTIWAVLITYWYANPTGNIDHRISIATFVAVPAAVIGVSQLLITTHIQRASYIKDYAIRFRTDREFSESFHYLIYRFGNELYEAYLVPEGSRNQHQVEILRKAQEGLAPDLGFFNPKHAAGLPQERRLDNLLGFFDTVAYDYSRQLVSIRDVAGVFGFHLDHLIQRKVVNDYLETIEAGWPKIKSFHERYQSPIPFSYLRQLLRAYIDYRASQDKQRS